MKKSCSELLDFTADRTGEKLGPADVARCDQVWQEERIRIAGITLVPPFAFLVAGLLLAWIVDDFRPAAKVAVTRSNETRNGSS
jgi:hypothetical protein